MYELRDEIARYLSAHGVGEISTSGSGGAWAMPVRYRSSGLEVECLLPRWADVTHFLQQDPNVLLLILESGLTALRWLEYRAIASPVASPRWTGLLPEHAPAVAPEDLYLVVRLEPRRVDLIDESRGWGVRETLEF